MTLARREPIPLGPAPWHRHRWTVTEHWRAGVWMTGAAKSSPEASVVRGRVTVRVRSCAVCGRTDVRETWAGGKRRWQR